MRTFIKLKTEYSITRSTITVKDGVALAKKHGFDALALADDGNMFATLDFANECVKSKVFPIIGCAIKLKFQSEIIVVTCFVKNKIGFENLLYLTSSSVLDSSEPWIVSFDRFSQKLEGLIILLSVPHKPLIAEILKNFPCKEDFYIEISRISNDESDVAREDLLLNIAHELNLPIIAGYDAYFQTPEMFEAADVLKCIGEGRFQLEDDRERFSINNYFKPSSELSSIFADLPEAIENANLLKHKITFCPKNSKALLPSFAVNEAQMLEELTNNGLLERIANKELLGFSKGFTEKDYFDRLKYEVKVIIEMGFCGYFLIVADFINWSKSNGIPVGPGRGSGAGSIVAYALNITDVDPLYYGLLFERFLNPDRVSMPDFDIDFCPQGRERVISYVKEKYGAESVAGIITFGRLQARAVLKDVGRVMQIPYLVVDKICKMIPFNPVDPVTLAKAIELDPELQSKREDDVTLGKLIDLSLRLEGLIRHSSTHAAGIIIADRPLIEMVPLFKSEGDDLPAVGYHMKAAELAGLVKFDFLGLKTLTVIKNTCELVEKYKNVKIDISKIPMRDSKTFELLQNGLTLGIFQLESMICRDAMRKMKIDALEDVIALTSLNRPGPMENIPSYINRKLGKEKISYPHPILSELLNDTYGIIIYQEQVIKIAQVLSGYTLGEADLLRRAMGKKIKEEMKAQRQMFIEGAVNKGIVESEAREIFELVEKFAGYGFNKSHAAAYSVISYQTAYLKAHFPVEFSVANLNMSLGHIDDINLFVNDAKQMGIKVHLPSIDTSESLFSTDGKDIFYGLAALKSVGHGSMDEMIEIRKEGGGFKDIFDFCKRVGNKIANKKQLESLTKSGAFDALGVNRKQILESVDVLTSFTLESQKEKDTKELSLFEEHEIQNTPKLKPVLSDFTSEEKLLNEFESVGFYLSFHPLLKFKDFLLKNGFTRYIDLEEALLIDNEKEKRFKMAGVVSIIKQRSGVRGRFAFLYLSDIEGIFEVSIFKEELITKHRDLLMPGKLIGILVSASKQENGSIRIIVNNIFPLEESNFSIEIPKKQNLRTKAKDNKPLEIDQNFDSPDNSQQFIKKDDKFYEDEVLNLSFKDIDYGEIKEIGLNFGRFKKSNGRTMVFIKIHEMKVLLDGKYDIPMDFIEKFKLLMS